MPATHLEQLLEGKGPFDRVADVRAVLHAGQTARTIARFERSLAQAGVGAATLQTSFALLRLDARSSGPLLFSLGKRLGGSPGAIVEAAAFLLEDRVSDLVLAARCSPLLARHSAQPYCHLRRVPKQVAQLFGLWVAELERASSQVGVAALRGFLGDVSEAAFRAFQCGAAAGDLLDERAQSWLGDLLCAELPGTTDFLAARGMTWLLGALNPNDDAARAAIERARQRFFDREFQRDCEVILSTGIWPAV